MQYRDNAAPVPFSDMYSPRYATFLHNLCKPWRDRDAGVAARRSTPLRACLPTAFSWRQPILWCDDVVAAAQAPAANDARAGGALLFSPLAGWRLLPAGARHTAWLFFSSVVAILNLYIVSHQTAHVYATCLFFLSPFWRRGTAGGRAALPLAGTGLAWRQLSHKHLP